jgi:hypothetical protein
VKSGISLLGDKVQSSLSKGGEEFPDTPEGHCITAVCHSIRSLLFSPLSAHHPVRLLAEASLSIRLNFLVENLNTTCKWLSRGAYGIGMKKLQIWFLSVDACLLGLRILRSEIQNDLMQKWDLPESHRPRDDFLDDDSEEDSDGVDEGEEIDNGEVTLMVALEVLSLHSFPLTPTRSLIGSAGNSQLRTCPWMAS